VIRFDAVTKRYPDGTVAVGDLTMDMLDGEITVLVGPSGCGKTTTLRMVNRMIEPTSGSIQIDGRDVMTIPAHELRRGIGYVIQQAGLFPHRRVVDNITTVPRLLRWDKRKAEARAAELLELVGLPAAMATRYPSQLSGGQQQRVGVARALAADPPVLLMDEPFGAVDPIVRGQLQQELLRLQGELHKTIVFVTHDIDEAILLGDRICVLSTGATIEQLSSPEEMLARPANSFVADFLGQDRGLKLLSLLPAESVETDEGTTSNGWTLELDGDGRPHVWRGPDGEEPVPAVSVGPEDTARGLLDAAVSAPSRAAVRTDAEGKLVGLVSYEAIGTLLADKLAEAAA
jgi:osmoprotectant transport system ATP-binding protein